MGPRERSGSYNVRVHKGNFGRGSNGGHGKNSRKGYGWSGAKVHPPSTARLVRLARSNAREARSPVSPVGEREEIVLEGPAAAQLTSVTQDEREVSASHEQVSGLDEVRTQESTSVRLPEEDVTSEPDIEPVVTSGAAVIAVDSDVKYKELVDIPMDLQSNSSSEVSTKIPHASKAAATTQRGRLPRIRVGAWLKSKASNARESTRRAVTGIKWIIDRV